MEIDESLVIRDANGTPKIVLTARSVLSTISIIGDDRAEIHLEAGDGRLGVRFRDSSGEESLAVVASDEGTVVMLRDDQSRTRVRLSSARPSMKTTCSVTNIEGEETTVFELPL